MLLVEGFWVCGYKEGEAEMEKLVERESEIEDGTDMQGYGGKGVDAEK